MSNSVRPHRWQPTRFHHPWDPPGKNTGVDCHFLLQFMKMKSEVTQSCPTLNDPTDCSLPGSSVHGIFQARVLEWGAIAFSYPFPPAIINFFSKSVSLCFVSSFVSFLFRFHISVSHSVSSVAQSCLTLCDPMNHSTPGLPVHHQLLELAQTHVHGVGDAVQPSHPLSSPSPPAPDPSYHQGLFQ